MEEKNKEKWTETQRMVHLLCVLSPSVVSDFVTLLAGLWPSRLLWTWEFSMQEYWSGLPCPQGLTQVSCIASRFFTIWATGEALCTNLLSFWDQMRGCVQGDMAIEVIKHTNIHKKGVPEEKAAE